MNEDLIRALAEALSGPLKEYLEERFDRIEALLLEGRPTMVSTGFKEVLSPLPHKVVTGTLDTASQKLAAKVVEGLLAYSFLTTESIEGITELRQSAAQRLIHAMDAALTFVILKKTSGSLSLTLTDPTSARDWMASIQTIPEWSTDFGIEGGTSAHAYSLYGPRIVKLLLDHPEGIKTSVIYKILGITRDMLLRVSQRINNTSTVKFLGIGLRSRGQAPLIKILDRDCALNWEEGLSVAP